MALRKTREKGTYFRVSPMKWVTRTGSSVIEAFNYIPGMDTISVTNIPVEPSRIPAAFKGMRIVILSDLHAHRFGKRQERLREAVRMLKPDLILVCGDWVRINYEDRDRIAIMDAARALSECAPVYSNLGNHEIHAFGRTQMIEELTKIGVTFLQNETAILMKEGQQLHLTGLTTRYSYYFGKNYKRRQKELKSMRAEFREAMENVASIQPLENASFGRDRIHSNEPEAYRILIAHRPELFKLYSHLGADLVLAGHAHGGLLKLGPNLRLLAPDQGLFPRYTHGSYETGKTEMIISQGLGGPRVGIRPELIFVEL